MIWRKPPKQLTILEQWESGSCMLYKVDSKLWGRVCTYKFVSKAKEYRDLLLTLDSLSLLKQKGLTPKKSNPLFTHFFVAYWDYGNPAVPMTRITSHLLDLVGTNFFAEDYDQIAAKVIEELAKHLSRIPPTKVESWMQQVERVNWIGLLEQFARAHNKLGERHQLIPGQE